MILVNTDYITGKELEMLSLVKGSTIQSKNIGRDITQSFKTIIGGELKAYTDMMNEARALATKRMVEEAEQLGASYLTAGHIYATDCKRGLPPRGLGFLKEVCREVSIPVYGIGGIKFDEEQWNDMKKCGAVGGCVMSGMMEI